MSRGNFFGINIYKNHYLGVDIYILIAQRQFWGQYFQAFMTGGKFLGQYFQAFAKEGYYLESIFQSFMTRCQYLGSIFPDVHEERRPVFGANVFRRLC